MQAAGIVGGIPCYFSENSLLAGNLANAFGRGGFDAVWMGLAGWTEPRDAGWLQIACKCSQASMQEGLT
jgi:hypothetical protein